MTNILEQSYEEFISQFPVYNTYKEAKAKGFEAHHIVPICTQEESTRGNPRDDRCVRLTAYEHILAHYLYCREHPDSIGAFTALNITLNMQGKKLLGDEKLFFEKLPSLSETRRAGYERLSSYFKGKKRPPEVCRRISEGQKGKRIPEDARKKSSISHTGMKQSEETKRKRSESLKGRKLNSETRRKMSIAKHNISVITRKKLSESHSKKVYQYDSTQSLINIFNNVGEAADHFGVSKQTICNRIKSKKEISSFLLSYTNYMNKEPNE